MYPEIFHIYAPQIVQQYFGESITIYSYGFMISMGIVIGYIYLLRNTVDLKIRSHKITFLIITLIVSSLLGGRTFYLLSVSTPVDLERPAVGSGGFVFYGSFIVSILGFLLWARIVKIDKRLFLDRITPSIIIVHLFGRIGCFLAGCCYGLECKNLLGISFTNEIGIARPLYVPLYPTQLFEVALNLLIFLALILRRKTAFRGQDFLTYVMLYAMGRIIIDYFRGDYPRDEMLHSSQSIAIFLIALAATSWSIWRKH